LKFLADEDIGVSGTLILTQSSTTKNDYQKGPRLLIRTPKIPEKVNYNRLLLGDECVSTF
jgi:hypothetical protein